MGSWNETCMISNLSIQYEDKVRYLILINNPFVQSERWGYATGMSPWQYWSPASIALEGTYDDCGRMVYTGDDLSLDYTISTLKKKVVKMLGGPNPYHDLPVEPSELTFDSFQDLVHEGRVFVTNGRRETFLVGRVMILDRVYQKMLSIVNKNSHVEEVLHKLERATSGDAYDIASLWDGIHFGHGSVTALPIFEYAQRLKEEGTILTKKELRFLAEQTCDIFRINNCLYELRKHWSPQVNGQQHEGEMLYTLMHEIDGILLDRDENNE